MPARRTVLREGALLGAGLAAGAPFLSATSRAAVSGAVTPYTAACVQTRVLPTWSSSGAPLPEARTANVETVARAIARTAGESGAKLLVFSEFCLQMPLVRLSPEQWEAGAVDLAGPEIARLRAAARRAGAYVVLNPVEAIAAFPGRYFLTGLLLSPSGEIALTYRKLYDLTSKTRPSDVLPQWRDLFGDDSLFPVADTPLGRIGLTVGTDANWPEMVRSLALRGAEVVATCLASPNVTPSSPAMRAVNAPDANDPALPVMARRLRAYENMAYMLTANLGPVGEADGNPLGAMQPSEIVDYHGNVLAASSDASARAITATLDIEAQRRARCTPGPANALLQLQSGLHAPDYAAARFDAPPAPGEDHAQAQRARIRDLVARGVLTAPASGLP